MIKRIIKSRFSFLYEAYQQVQRKKILKNIDCLKKLSDNERIEVLNLEYKNKIGHDLNWDNLITYTEKMQWEKLYDKNPLKSILADKYLVRSWIKDKIGEEYLIPLLGVWDSFEEIDFGKLPDKFVLKTNHGSGTVVIVRDKSKINIKSLKKQFDDWMKMDFGFTTFFEMHYSDIKPKILAEKYIEAENNDLQDYKFLCFDGEPEFCWVDIGRFSKHTRTVFDLKWKRQPWTQAEYGQYEGDIPRPDNFEKMVELSRILCDGFSHVRVDFYNVGGKIYFGEMTFTNGSGLDKIVPNEYDTILGGYWNIPS